MEDTWYTGIADELARCLTDAARCADACEELLADVSESEDGRFRKQVIDAVVGPAAVSRVLVDLVDQPRALVLAAATLCRDSASDAAELLAPLPVSADAVSALRACASSCAALLAAA